MLGWRRFQQPHYIEDDIVVLSDPVTTDSPLQHGESERGQAHVMRGEMLYGIHDLSRLITMTYDRLMAKYGLTYAQWWTLLQVSRHEGASQSDIARLLGKGRAAAGQQIIKMEALGLIRREGDDNDRRTIRLYITDKGRALMRPMAEEALPYFARVFAGFIPEEEEALSTLVRKLTDGLLAEAG